MMVASIAATALLVFQASPLSCAAAAPSAVSRDVLLAMSNANDERLRSMVDRIHSAATTTTDVDRLAAETRASAEAVQTETDAFASAFEAYMCKVNAESVTPIMEAGVRNLGNNIRNAPLRMRATALRGTETGDLVLAREPAPPALLGPAVSPQ